MHQLFLQALREAETLPRESFDMRRMPLVAGLLDHMWRTVPLYHERLAPLLDANGLDLARWSELPLLRAADVAEYGERLLAARLPPEAREVEMVPAESNLGAGRRSRLARVADECARERAYEHFGLDLSALLAILHPGRTGPAEGVGWSLTFESSPWMAGDPDASAAEQLAWLRRTGARVLRTDLRRGRMLGAAAAASGAPEGLLTVIIDDVDLDPEGCSAIAEDLSVDLWETLTVEGVGVVTSGRLQDGYAAAAGSMVVEVVDPDGRPCAEGELVVTPLYEYCRPLLRFATGVGATALEEPSTALGVRRLARLGGRLA